MAVKDSKIYSRFRNAGQKHSNFPKEGLFNKILFCFFFYFQETKSLEIIKQIKEILKKLPIKSIFFKQTDHFFMRLKKSDFIKFIRIFKI